jgi:multidrug efflux pump subunit AcrA (membrane-fusion protein)
MSAIAQWETSGTANCFRVADGHAVRTRIKIDHQDGARAEVLDGLKEGDVVITKPDSRIADGQPVTIRP